MSEGTKDSTKPVVVKVSVGGTNFLANGTVERIEEHEVETSTRPAVEDE